MGPHVRLAGIDGPTDLGRLFRAERKRKGLTLAEVADATALSLRFLSEFERGKENASIGRVLRALTSLGLDVLVLPRAEATAARRLLSSSRNKAAKSS